MGNHGESKHELKHEQHDKWGHLAHYAHQSHLAAEGVEFAAHKLHHATELIAKVQVAAKLAKAHGQMAYDLRRMGNGIGKLERISREGGARGANALKELGRARAAFQAAQAEFQAEGEAVGAAGKVLREYRLIQSGAKGQALVKLGEAATSLEAALNSSRLGSKLLTAGRVTSSKTFVRGLVVVGAACEGAASYADSTARTTGGKFANAVVGAGSGALTMANPVVAVADLIAPKGYKLSEVYHGGAGAVTAIGEGILTNDTKAMDDFHQRSMKGHYGKVMQAASEAGEYWANKGVSGGLKEFADSIHWWISH